MDRLTGTVQHYAWGSVDDIPRFLGVEPDGRPQAELWLGAHPTAPSSLERDGVTLTLDQVIDLPFLLKVLAAAEPLSIQCHPSRAQAEAGYAREEADGVPLDAGHRVYRDRNHKPELLCALTPFRALCGFRAPGASAQELRSLGEPALDELAGRLEDAEPAASVQAVVTELLTTTPERKQELVDALTAALADGRGDAALRDWLVPIAARYPGDVGVLIALLLHRLELQPGEAIHLDAGQMHAYVSGVGIEVMASSDNVVRGGLTGKHIDVDELVRIVDFAPTEASVVRARDLGEGVAVYDTPADEFELLRLHLDAAADAIEVTGPAIVLSADAEVHDDEGTVLQPGQAAFVAAAAPARLRGRGTAWVAHLPAGQRAAASSA